MFCFFLWNDFFSYKQPEHFRKGMNITERLPNKNFAGYTSVYILYCFFQSSSKYLYGGAIYVDSIKDFMVESSTFFKCTTDSDRAGAIYCSTTSGGSSVLSKVCGCSCYCKGFLISSPQGQFCIIKANDGNNFQKNVLYDSSIIKMENTNKRAKTTVDMFFGNITLDRNNISYNKVASSPAFRLSNPSECKVKYMQITRNSASDKYCFEFDFSNVNIGIETCNIISNTVSFDSIVMHLSKLEIQNSCFLFNMGASSFSDINNVYLYGSTIDDSSVSSRIFEAVSSSFMNNIVVDFCNTDKANFFPTTLPHLITCKRKMYRYYQNRHRILNFIN